MKDRLGVIGALLLMALITTIGTILFWSDKKIERAIEKGFDFSE